MSHSFASKNARILIAEEAGSLRQLLSDTMRSLGYKDITVFANAADVFSALERECCDWLILPTFRSHTINSFQILKTISEVPRLQHIKVSLFVDKEDMEFLPQAFHFGLLSWHFKQYFQENVLKEMGDLLELLKRNQWIPSLVAEDFLRRFLFEKQNFDEVVSVERSLLNLFPGSINLLLKYGEALLRSGKIAEGLNTLKQACLIDERAQKFVDILQKKHADLIATASTGDVQNQNILGIKTCVLIDPDTLVLATVKNLLVEAGVPTIEAFEDGEEAWKWLSTNKEPDFIIQEWRIPKLTGPILLQRMRHHGFNNVPINVISSVIKPEESHLLREYGVSNVIAKPFVNRNFFNSIVWTLQQQARPTEQNFLDGKIRRLLAVRNFAEAERLKELFMSDRQIQTSSKKSIEAEFAFQYGRYSIARDIAIEALRLSGDSLSLLNLIGKCLLKLGDYPVAMQIFEKAHALSPINLDHLCQLAMSQLDGGKVEESARTLKQAAALDKDSVIVTQTRCQVAILKGDPEEAREIMQQMSSISIVTAYMNNRAIALTRSGQFDNGIALYLKTIDAIPPERQDVRDSVIYNLGLAYARYSELTKAKDFLASIVKRKNSTVFNKASSLLKRVVQAQEGGLSLSFYDTKEDDVDLAQPKAPRPVSMTKANGVLIPGEMCLFGIYKIEKNPGSIPRIFENAPMFKDYLLNPEQMLAANPS